MSPERAAQESAPERRRAGSQRALHGSRVGGGGLSARQGERAGAGRVARRRWGVGCSRSPERAAQESAPERRRAGSQRARRSSPEWVVVRWHLEIKGVSMTDNHCVFALL
jgi:hypothetical protein